MSVYITKKEVCELLSVSKSTVDRLVTKGKLTRFHPGGIKSISRYSKEQVMSIMKEQDNER